MRREPTTRRRAVARDPLAERASAAAAALGRTPTGWPHLSVYRHDVPRADDQTTDALTLCVILRGQKTVQAGAQRLVYDPDHFLAVTLPTTYQGTITRSPYLALGLALPAALVAEQAAALALPAAPGEAADWPLAFVAPLDAGLRDAFARLLDAAADARAREALCPVIEREIVVRLLLSPAGAPLRAAAARLTQTRPLLEAMRYMRAHCHERLTVPQLARRANMSTSAFAHGFTTLARVPPIRFLRQARLERARLLMLRDGLQAGEAAYRVGYRSPSQFSRDFKRTFGAPPAQYAGRRAAAS